MRAPHEIARIRHGVGFFKPSPERLARHLAMYDVIHLELENGQKVVVRPLTEERRWRAHDPHSDARQPKEAKGRIEVQFSSGERFKAQADWFRWHDGPHASARVTRWRPAR